MGPDPRACASLWHATGDGLEKDNFAIARLNSNGTADPTFGSLNLPGRVITNFGADASARAPALGHNGSFDATFSGDGIVTVDFSRDDHGFALARESDGRYLLGGSTGAAGAASDYALVRVLP